MIELQLLGTEGCHLCEQADELINLCLTNDTGIEIRKIDIADHAEWQERYAARIPVLRHEASANELSWPFDQDDIDQFLGKSKKSAE